MYRFRVLFVSAFALSAIISFTPIRASASDSCQPILDALTKVATTPSHSYTTGTAVNGGKPTEGETIIANGQKYIRAHEKWMRIGVTSQDLLEQEKEKEEHGKSTCQFLRSESVNGEAAMLYSVHREYEEVKEDGHMWISRGNGLLLRVEEDFDNGGNKVKEHRSTRFEYGNVKPPM
jgi:hypothetical protein